MPYNGSGLFTRNYNWVNDKNSAIPITASRVDADSNDFASGLSNAITRDGQGPATSYVGIIGAGATPITSGFGDNASSQLFMNKSGSGHAVSIRAFSNAVQRWQLTLGNTTPETGSQNGSDLSIDRYNDSGALVDSPITINRASGVVTINNLNVLSGITAPVSTTAITGTSLNISGSPGTATFAGAATFTASYGIQASVAAGLVAEIDFTVAGKRTYAVGEHPSGYFRIVDNTAAVERMTMNSSGVFQFFNQVLVSAGTDPIQCTAPAGSYARYSSTVTGARQWMFGTRADGTFSIEDIGGALRFQIGQSNGNITMSNGLTVNGNINSNTIIGTGIQVNTSGSAAWHWSSVAGVRTWFWGCNTDGSWLVYDSTANAERFSIDTSGNATVYQGLSVFGQVTLAGNFQVNGSANVNGQITAGSNLIANSAIYVAGTSQQVLYSSGNLRIHQFQANWFWSWDAAVGTLLWNNPTAGNNVQFSANGNTVNKTGAWLTWSDARIKQDIADYSGGLKEICGLRPRYFRFKGDVEKDSAAALHIGIVAQEAEKVMPEMIESGPHSRDGIDYTDFRTASTSPVIWALVNAVKELNARLKTLEGKL